MKTNTIIGIVVVIAVAVGAYFFWGGSKSVENSATYPTGEAPTNGDVSASSSAGKKMAFSEFLKQGGSYKCVVNQNVGGVETQGTTYVNNGMIRGEYHTNVAGMSIDSHVIVMDGYTYSWSSAYPTLGFKAKVTANAGMEDGTTGTSGTYSFNAEQIGDYSCEAWTFDATMFALPKGITFKAV